jgi:hypothetical protein
VSQLTRQRAAASMINKVSRQLEKRVLIRAHVKSSGVEKSLCFFVLKASTTKHEVIRISLQLSVNGLLIFLLFVAFSSEIETKQRKKKKMNKKK